MTNDSALIAELTNGDRETDGLASRIASRITLQELAVAYEQSEDTSDTIQGITVDVVSDGPKGAHNDTQYQSGLLGLHGERVK